MRASEVRAAPVATLERLRIAALLALAIGVFGIVARDVAAHVGMAQPNRVSSNVFFRLYVLHEGPFLWLLALAAALAWMSAARVREGERSGWGVRAMAMAARVPTWTAALAVLAMTLVGGAVLLHGIGLSMDEFTASFQARIFASGRLQATVPTEWRELAPWMTPVFVNYKPVSGVWVSSYLPGYAAIRAIFALAGAESLTNPALAALTVALLVAVARRMWAGDRAVRGATLALLFLVLSAQFLVTSMSAYSMTAHLCLNLLWLWLYLRNDKVALAAAPWVGVLALGLHNPIPHALFVAPFLVRLLRERRFAWVAYSGVVYLAGAIGWYQWLEFVQTDVSGAGAVIGAGVVGDGLGGGVAHTFALPGLFRWFVQGMSLSLLFSWQTPAVALFLPIAFIGWRRLSPTERDLAAGLIGTWLFHAFFNADQGHGWGYRYMHAVLGNVVLLAASGAEEVWRGGREALVGRLVVASALLTVALQWPVRAVQTERFVRPYAAALEHVATRPAEVVTVDPWSAWYARDFVRNDPFLAATPKVVGLRLVGGRWPDPGGLPGSARGRVYPLTAKDLAGLGVPVFEPTRR
ncbi:MAG: hypothetical protein M3282_05275 [Gemmatimonadota bacterium]|nr:hypothetical protein [Gemmatimonadota bacterium]